MQVWCVIPQAPDMTNSSVLHSRFLVYIYQYECKFLFIFAISFVCLSIRVQIPCYIRDFFFVFINKSANSLLHSAISFLCLSMRVQIPCYIRDFFFMFIDESANSLLHSAISLSMFFDESANSLLQLAISFLCLLMRVRIPCYIRRFLFYVFRWECKHKRLG